MNSPAILDADMATVARWARSGFAWWLEELRALVPARWQQRLARQPPVEARFDGNGFVFARQGMGVPRPTGPVAVVLAEGTALVREVQLPALGATDLRRLLALESERLLPFAPGTALIDHDTGAADGDGRQTVVVAGLPLAAADAAMAAAAADGLDVRSLRVATGAGARFDFLPAWPGQASAAKRPQRFWWGAVAIAAAINLAVLIGRDVAALHEMAALVETHAQTAATARQLLARVIGEDTRRRALLARRAVQDPLTPLAAVTRAFPDSIWVQRLAWDGSQLRIAGYKPGSVDAVALLRRSPVFAEVRSVAGDVPAQVTSGQPFELTADARPRS